MILLLVVFPSTHFYMHILKYCITKGRKTAKKKKKQKFKKKINVDVLGTALGDLPI